MNTVRKTIAELNWCIQISLRVSGKTSDFKSLMVKLKAEKNVRIAICSNFSDSGNKICDGDFGTLQQIRVWQINIVYSYREGRRHKNRNFFSNPEKITDWIS